MTVPVARHLTLSNDYIVRVEPSFHNSCTAFNWRTCQSVFLDMKALSLVELASRHPLNVRSFHDDTTVSIIHKLVQDGVLIAASRQPERERAYSSIFRAESAPNAAFPVLSFPTRVDATITRLCDMRCVHCNVTAGKRWPDELHVDEWIDVFDQLERGGLLKLQVTGGEATKHRDFPKLLEHLGKKRYFKSILTNAASLTEPVIQAFAAYNVSLGVSLDGATAEAHDGFRKSPGSFNRLMTNLERLHDSGVQCTITCTVHRSNLDHIEQVFDIAARFDAAILQFGFIDSVGRGTAADRWATSLAETVQVREEFYRMRARYPSLTAYIEDPINLMNGTGSGQTFAPCKAGRYSMALDCDGTAFSCTLGVQLRALPMGNVRDQSIHEIWNNDAWSSFRGSIKLGDLAACSSCKYNGACTMKKCRMRSIQETGNILGRPYKCPGTEIEAVEALNGGAPRQTGLHNMPKRLPILQ